MDSNTLELQADYTRYSGERLSASITLPQHKVCYMRRVVGRVVEQLLSEVIRGVNDAAAAPGVLCLLWCQGAGGLPCQGPPARNAFFHSLCT